MLSESGEILPSIPNTRKATRELREKPEKLTRRQARDDAKRRRRTRRRRLLSGLLILAVASLLLFVPVPAGFLKGTIQNRVRKTLGLEVTFKEAWLTVVAGRIELVGVELRNPDHPKKAFGVGTLELSGPPEGWISSQVSWPTLVIVENTDAINLRVSKSGVDLRGALEGFADRIRGAQARRPASPEGEPSSLPPSVRVVNSQVVLDSATTVTSAVSLSVSSLVFLPDLSGSEDFQVDFAGMVRAGSVSPMRGRVEYHAAGQLWNAAVSVDSLSGSGVLLSDRADLWWQAGGLRAAARIRTDPGRGLSANLAFNADSVDLADRGNGSGSLYRGPLGIDFQAFRPEDADRWNIRSLSVRGPDLDLILSGDLMGPAPVRYRVDLALTRLPGRVLSLLQKELTRHRVSVDIPTTSSLRVTAHVEGQTDQWTSSTVTGSVSIDAAQVRSPFLRRALNLGQIRGELTGRGARVSIGRWQTGEVGGSASAVLDGLPFAGAPSRLVSRFQLDGSVEELLRVARGLDLVPPEVERIEGQLRGEGQFEAPLSLQDGVLAAGQPYWTTELSWVDGRLYLANWQDAIDLESGALRIRPDELNVVRLRSRTGGVDLRWEGTLHGRDDFFWESPRFRFRTTGETTPAALGRFLDLGGVGAAGLEKAEGTLRVEFEGAGSFDSLSDSQWKGTVAGRNLAFQVPTRGAVAQVHDLNFEAALTSQTLTVHSFAGQMEDIGLEGSLSVDGKAIRLDGNLRGPVETVLRLFRRDLAEFRGEGVVPATFSASLEAVRPLESPNLPVVARWVQALAKPGAIQLNGSNSPIRPTLQATLLPDGASFWQEEMPQTVTNIRGRITADLTGLQIHNVRSQWGDVPDCIVNGRVRVGKLPTRVEFDIKAPRFRVDDWIEGWSQPPDGIQARRIYQDAHTTQTIQALAVLDGTVRAQEVSLQRMKGRDFVGRLRFESWRGAPSPLAFERIQTSCYEGTASGSLHLVVQGHGKKPDFRLVAQTMDIDVQPFLTDLLGREGQTVGLFDGYVRLGGNFGDVNTFKGEGSVLLRNTRVLGGPVLPLLGSILKATVVSDVTFTDIRGSYHIEDGKVVLNRVFMDSPGVRLLADGSIGLNGGMDLEVTAGFFSQTLNKIPGFSTVTSLFHQLGASFLKFRVTGRLEEPEVVPVPFSADLVEKLFTGGS